MFAGNRRADPGKLVGSLDMLVTLVELTLESRLPRIYGVVRVNHRP